MATQPVRTKISYAILLIFLVSFLWAGLQHDWHDSLREALALGNFPLSSATHTYECSKGCSHPVHLRTITASELALDKQRLIFVGDIHGMKSSIDKLLSKISYNASSDFFIHLGDIVAKGPGSLQVLSEFSDANVTGVRGNHEQTVINWRSWIEWVEGHRGGKKWLKKLEDRYPDGIVWKKHKHKLRWPIPKKWEFMGDHYKIARHMSASQYGYLKSLPLAIHLPSLHTFAVHAGILPFNPKYPPDSPGQPLAHAPTVSSSLSYPTRSAQERALVTDIKQNTDPWVLLNIRTVLQTGEVSRKFDKGTPWPDLWNMIVEQCHGYRNESSKGLTLDHQDESTSASLHLSCLPINVVYGHFASRGLDVRRWSFGLDDGCVKGRHLTAMVISQPTNFMPIIDAKVHKVPFGEHEMAQIISVRCPKNSSKSVDG